MAFESVGNQLEYIAKNGNYQDLANTMTLISAYGRTYLTGRAPIVRKIKGGKEAASVTGLQHSFVGATHQTNSIHDWNKARDKFFELVALVSSEVYANVDPVLYSRMGIVTTPGFPIDVEDCDGNVLGTANDLSEYLTLWNDQKVPTDQAICDAKTSYLFDTGVAGFLGKSDIQPDNSKIIYNAKSVTTHSEMPEVQAERRKITSEEEQVAPKSIPNYTKRDI